MIRVLVLGDVRLYREGIAQFLDSRAGITVTGTAKGLQEAGMLVSLEQPHVVLVDATRSESLGAVRSVARLAPGAKIVVLGIPEMESEIIDCAEAGVAGYVLRDDSLDDLVAVIEAVVRGDLVCTPTVAAMLLRGVARGGAAVTQMRFDGALTRRELEIALLIGEGLQNKEIATRLYLALPTVKNHVHNLLAKLGVSTRSEVAAWAVSGDSRTARGRLSL